MRLTVILVSLILSTSTALAESFKFSPYSCEFNRSEGGDWKILSIGYFDYMTQLDWNQTSAISKFKLEGNISGELGICAEVASQTPDFTYLSLFFVDGYKVNFDGNSCVFTGESVKFTSHYAEITKVPQYLHGQHRVVINGTKLDILFIAGILEIADQDPYDICVANFKEITGSNLPKVSQSLEKDQLKRSYKKIFGFKTK